MIWVCGSFVVDLNDFWYNEMIMVVVLKIDGLDASICIYIDQALN